MTKSVGVHEAKTHLSRILAEVASGAQVEITNRGQTVAVLVPPPLRAQPNYGFDRGRVRVADDFDTLPDDMLDAFES